jgi:signal peptidase
MGTSGARRYTQWILDALLIALMMGSLALVGLARLVPATGHPVFIIDSGSMVPTIPVGAAVVLDPGSAGVRTGDVVTMRLDSGAIFTHRITRLVSLDGVTHMETKGDANPTVDPALTPVDHVMGRVVLTIPLAGFLMAGLAMPAGMVTALMAAITLIVALWLLDEDDAESEEVAQPDAVGDPAGAAARATAR